jgi:anaerobic magnesium-protoporphyrin IX monomethyl ester cyclase
MKVCMVNAPWEQDGKWGLRAGCRFPNLMPRKHNAYVPFPFLLAYTASYLDSKGMETLVIDAVAERLPTGPFLDRMRKFGPDLVVAETSTTSFPHDVGVMARIKEQFPAVPIAMFGPHMDALPEDGLKVESIDFVIQGEPELTVYDLAEALSKGGPVGSIPGLQYRGKATPGLVGIGTAPVQSTPRRGLVDIEALPYPKRQGMPLDRYSVAGFPAPLMFMYASRGCPYRCNFCLWPQTMFETGDYRPRTPEAIVDEIQYVLKEFPQTRSLFFDDDTFNLGRDRLLRFAREMKSRRIKIPWGMNARADHWDREMLESLKETGLFTLRIGIESGDQHVLDETKKALKLDQARATLELSHSLGIKNHVFFMVGLADESWESIENTVRFVKSTPVDSVQFSVAVPFPGTDYYRYVKEKGFLETTDWSRYSGSDTAVMRTTHLTSDEIRRAIIKVRRRVYFTPRFIRRRLGYIRNLHDLSAIARKAVLLAFQRS